MWDYEKRVPIERMIGENIVSVEGLKQYSDAVKFKCENGVTFTMTHFQDCCEQVSLEDWTELGELTGIVVKAEESVHDGKPGQYGESETWTFYIITTMNGRMVLRWCGSSNGYYSESVDFIMEEETA